MRLLLVTQDFPPDVGGTQTYAFELARRWAPNCADFAVVAPQVSGAAAHDAALPFGVIRVHASYDTLSFRALRPLLQLAAHRGFDTTFHVQWPTALSALAARRMGKLRRVYVAAHGRELLLAPLPSLFNPLYRRLRDRVLTHADGLFPVSRYTGDLLKQRGVGPGRITVVPNGTDAERFAPCDATALRQALGVADRRVVLTVSRLVPRKGIDTVLRALARTAAAVPDVVYLVGGSGPDRPRLEALARAEGVADRVRFLGRIPEEALALHYNACDVFVMPARLDPPHVEGFGIVFLEANACGKPVIGARTGGIPDAILDGETGLLVEPDAPGALAEAMIRVLRQPELADRLGRQGRTRVLAEATWDHVASRLLAAL